MFSILFYMTLVQQFGSGIASSYLPVLASNGSQLCALGTVSYTIQTDDIIGVPYVVPGATKCGFFCTGLNRMTKCIGFNYLTSGLCQFFSHMCITTHSRAGCIYYQVDGYWIVVDVQYATGRKKYSFECPSEYNTVHAKPFCLAWNILFSISKRCQG
jgi:hypothetical protein